jgi:prepilin-type N-terminal cleavage/methylation domain-containing protein/prepilin-type processing-associated H-X9-DG protein
MKRRGFTLIELIVVISIISLLAAILFPVFDTVRARARQTVCLSNLHQLGVAVTLYAQDNDDFFPYGGDAGDRNTDAWQTADGGKYWPEAHLLPALPDILQPYTSSRELWHCPADTGFDYEDAASIVSLKASPTSYSTFGLSYYYRTILALQHQTLSGVVAYEPNAPFAQHGPSEINVLSDSYGFWHGDAELRTEHFNTLMADGHAASLTKAKISEAWGWSTSFPTSP